MKWAVCARWNEDGMPESIFKLYPDLPAARDAAHAISCGLGYDVTIYVWDEEHAVYREFCSI